MTLLIYRGFTHVPTTATKSRSSKDLIYRGVRHNGMQRKMPWRARAVEMCYRTVHYAKGPDGVVAIGGRRAEFAVTGATAPTD